MCVRVFGDENRSLCKKDRDLAVGCRHRRPLVCTVSDEVNVLGVNVEFESQ
jgi:hypothetical protein